MVREQKQPADGVDANQTVTLSEELEKAGKATDQTAFPEGEPTKTPIDIRGDATPEKKG